VDKIAAVVLILTRKFVTMIAVAKHIPRWMKNKYLLVTAAFLLFILVFDNRNLPNQYNRYRELKHLQNTATNLAAENKKLVQDNESLRSNPIEIERVAREKYYMKRGNETVFLFPDTEIKK
jgi:cell division protein DivIC